MLVAQPIEIKWQSELPIFASERYLALVGNQYGWLGGFDCHDRLRCVLPYTIIRKPWFRMVRFRVETIALGGELEPGEEESFLESATSFFRNAGADLILPGANNAIFRSFPKGARVAPYGTYVVDLRQPEEVLWKNMHKNNRKAIRQAINSGVTVRHGAEYAQVVHAQIDETLRRSGQRFVTFAKFSRLINGLESNVRIFVVEHEGTVQGCAVNFFSNHTAYSFYAGSATKPIDGATKLLHWEAMKHFKALSVARYDFSGARINPEKGSKQERLVFYKRELGGRLVQGYMWKYPLRPAKFAIYGMAVRAIRGGDIVDLEQHKLETFHSSMTAA